MKALVEDDRLENYCFCMRVLYIDYICLLFFFLKENHTGTKILSAAKNNESSDFLTSLVGDPNKPESNRKNIGNRKIHGYQETFFLTIIIGIIHWCSVQRRQC